VGLVYDPRELQGVTARPRVAGVLQHLPLDRCSPLELDYSVYLLLHDYLDQDLMWVE
jgi:hypothetical protein